MHITPDVYISRVNISTANNLKLSFLFSWFSMVLVLALRLKYSVRGVYLYTTAFAIFNTMS